MQQDQYIILLLQNALVEYFFQGQHSNIRYLALYFFAHCALFILPIHIALTLILSLANSFARDLVRLIPAALETLVGNLEDSGTLPVPVVALTIQPLH